MKIYIRLTLLMLLVVSISSCVSSKKYNRAMHQNRELDSMLAGCQWNKANLQAEVNTLVRDTTEMGDDMRSLMTRYNNLFQDKMTTEQALSAELQEKQEKMEAYEIFLAEREQKVRELQSIIRRQDSLTRAVMRRVQDALIGFTREELTVEMRDGRVYVSLSEQLLFPSGSYTVNPKGRDAIEKLSDALMRNPDIQIMIEGHTDDRPIKTGCIRDNWDLSVLRATSVVNIVTKRGVDASRLVACGKGEFQPVAQNETAAGRQQNRRTEIVLSPKLDELYNLLQTQN